MFSSDYHLTKELVRDHQREIRHSSGQQRLARLLRQRRRAAGPAGRLTLTPPYARGVLGGRAGISPVMVGRSAELDRLVGLIGAGTSPTIALIAGEAGIGKTRLAQELVRRSPAGTMVLAGQADPGTVGRPMELYLDAQAAWADAADAELMAVVIDADRPADERIHAGVDLVRRLTDGQPGLVIFEDLHWADSESVRVFERLAEPETGPMLLVGTYRPDGLSRRHPASEMLPRLERRHSVTHLHLERLTAAEVSSFLAAVYEEEPSFRVVDALHTRTGGNPFFLEELVASAAHVSSAELADMPLPWTVEELVRSEVDELDPEVREMLSAASVLGRRVTFDLLAAVTRASEDDLIAQLRSAVDHGLLVESDPDVFRFHHELAREAIEGGLLGRERRRLHEVAFDALRSTHSRDHVALAHHARGAGRYDETIAEARLGAHESLSLGSSFQALRLAETGLAEAPDDLELLSLAARAAWLAALPDDAADHCDRWLALARSAGDLSEVAAALSLRIRLAFEQGDIPAMVRFTDALIEIIDRLPNDVERAESDARGGAVVPAARAAGRDVRVGRSSPGAGRAGGSHRRSPGGDGGEGFGPAHASRVVGGGPPAARGCSVGGRAGG